MLEAVIFDMDGVLLDSENIHFRIFKEILTERGYPYTLDHFLRYCGMSEAKLWRPLLKELEAVDEDPEKMMEEHLRRFNAELEKNNLKGFPGLKECLKSLKQAGLKLAVASASGEYIVKNIINQLGIEEYFDSLIAIQPGMPGKPNPDIFLLAAQRLGVEPERCLVVEDSKNGMIAAKRAGMKWVGFNGASIPTDMSEAVIVFSDYQEINVENFRKWYDL